MGHPSAYHTVAISATIRLAGPIGGGPSVLSCGHTRGGAAIYSTIFSAVASYFATLPSRRASAPIWSAVCTW